MGVSPKTPPTPHRLDVLGTLGGVSGFVRGKASNVCQGNLFLEVDGSVNDGDGYCVEVLYDGTNGVTNGAMHDETNDGTLDAKNDGAQQDELPDEEEDTMVSAGTVCPSHQGRCIRTYPHRVPHRLTNRNRRHWTVLSVQNGWTDYRTLDSALHPTRHPTRHPKHPNERVPQKTVQPWIPNEPKPSPLSVV